MLHPQYSPAPRRQRGAIMAIVLILLLVMTVIGVSTMRSSVREVAMAGSMQQQEDALRDAERALAMAEEQIEVWTSDGSFTPAAGGFYRSNPPETRTADWSGITAETGATSGDSARTTAASNFVVMYIGPRVLSGESLSEGRGVVVKGKEVYMFRPVARSAQSERAIRIIESLYATDNKP